MYLTEEQALKKCCVQNAEDSCCADNCMGWRWRPLQADTAYLTAVKQAMKDYGFNNAVASAYVNENRSKLNIKTEPFEGFCGLAGAPVTK